MMMRKIFTMHAVAAVCLVYMSAQAQDSLFISELADPADDYSGRFVELYNAGSEPVDFGTSICYLSRQSNGGTSWGDLRLEGSIAAGATFVIGGSGFGDLYGFAPDQETGILIGNGDDAYAIFTGGDHETGVLLDIFGAIDVDGSGEPWEYEDARALRLEAVRTPGPVWNAAEWEITPAGVADCDPGTHLGSVAPAGDLSLALGNDTVILGQVVELAVSVSGLTTGDNIISCQFDLSYNPSVLSYIDCSLEGTLGEGGSMAVNDGVPGSLSVAYMHSIPLAGNGTILLLHFNPLMLDTTGLWTSNAYLNNTPVPNLIQGTVVVGEAAPPTAAITYSDTLNRFADTLVITATFSEAMNEADPVLLMLEGAVQLADAEMTRHSATTYSYAYPVPKAGGQVSVSLSNGTDLWGNEVVATPEEGDVFFIIPFRAGDVDDDGMVLAYDAALTLQYSVGIDPLPLDDPLPWEPWRDSTANVDGTGGISAYDAGMILQYSAGLISAFTSSFLKAAPSAGITVEVSDQYLIFRSLGELLGLNLEVVNISDPPGDSGTGAVLGMPVIPDRDFMWACNINEDMYRIGLCTALAPEDGAVVMKIPYQGSGALQLNLMLNTTEQDLQVDLLTGLTNPGDVNELEIFPNPVDDKIHLTGLHASARVSMYNILGQLLLTVAVEEPGGEISLQDLGAGVYLMVLETEDGRMIHRFLKSERY